MEAAPGWLPTAPAGQLARSSPSTAVPVCELLEVVQHQQQLAPSQPTCEALRRRELGLFCELERLADDRSDQLGIDDLRKADKPRPIAISRRRCLSHPEREPGLAAAAGPGQRQQTRVGSRPMSCDFGKLVRAAEERGGRQWQTRLWFGRSPWWERFERRVMA